MITVRESPLCANSYRLSCGGQLNEIIIKLGLYLTELKNDEDTIDAAVLGGKVELACVFLLS